MVWTVSVCAQFIPQSMGYNPDSDNDGFVGSEDLMGLLSHYGNEFDNGDSIITANLNFVPENFYDQFCVGTPPGQYTCEELACDNFPIYPLELPIADIYNINVPDFTGEDWPWYTESYNWGSFIATLPEVTGFKSILIFVNVPENTTWGDRTIRFYSEGDFNDIPFDLCAPFQNTQATGFFASAQSYSKRFNLLIHTSDGNWKSLMNFQ